MKKSLLNRYKNTIPGKYIWVKNDKAPVRGYGDVFIIIIIFSEENEYNNPIIKIIRIPNIIFYLSFLYNIISF